MLTIVSVWKCPQTSCCCLLQHDMFDLLLHLRQAPQRFAAMRPGARFRSWQLVWSELDARCSPNSPDYDPCTQF